MEIKILGMGCAKCANLADLVREVVAEMGIDAQVDKVEEIQEIMSYGVMATPAMVIDGQVKIAGSVPSKAKVLELITTELAKRD